MKKLDYWFRLLCENVLGPSCYNRSDVDNAKLLVWYFKEGFAKNPSYTHLLDSIYYSLKDDEEFTNMSLEEREKFIVELLKYIGHLAEINQHSKEV